MLAFMARCPAADAQLAASGPSEGRERITGQSHYEATGPSLSFRLNCLINLICSNRITLPVFTVQLHRWLHTVYFSFIFNGGLPRQLPQNTASVPESGARNLRGKAKWWRKLEIHKPLLNYTI